MYSAPTRVDTITNRKVVKGFNSDTFQDDMIVKNKINTVVETDKPENEYFEESMKNPEFGVSRIKGADVSEKQILHGYRYNHSIGEIDFVNLEAVEFAKYGAKVNSILLNPENWEWILDEPFRSTADSPAGAWTDNTTIATHTSSSGDDLQYKTIDWHLFNSTPATSTTKQVIGDQSLRVPSSVARAQLNKMYSHYEVSFYFQGVAATNYIIFSFDQSGYDTNTDKGFTIELDYANSLVQYNIAHADWSTVTHSVAYTFTDDVWYKFRMVKLGRKVIIYINDTQIVSYTVDQVAGGDLSFYANTDGYIDQVRMKVLKRSVIGIVQGLYTKAYKSYIDNIGIHGTQQTIYDEDIITIDQEFSNDSQMLLEMKDAIGNEIKDKTTNNNHGTIRNGSIVEDGMLGYGVELQNGDIQILDDSTISDLAEFNLHTRFRLQNMETEKRSLQANPIISKGHEFVVYDYKKRDGLIGHWKLNDDLNDYSGFGYDGTANGTVTSESAKIGSGRRFNANNDYIDVGAIPSPTQTTIALWFKLNGSQSNHSTLFSNRDATAVGDYLIQYSYTANNIQCSTYDGASFDVLSTNTSLSVDTWYHLVYTYNYVDNVQEIYLNGELDAIGKSSGTFTPSGHNYLIGDNLFDTFMGDITLDDVRFYDRVLDDVEISQIYNGGNGTEDKINLHRIAFEIYGELLIGDEIIEGDWNEFWFLSDGKSSFIYRRDSSGLAQPEARKVLGELLIWLPLDSSVSSTVPEDKSVNAGADYTFVKYSGSPYVAGRLQNGLDIDEDSVLEYVEVVDNSSHLIMDNTKPLSHQLWFKWDSTEDDSVQTNSIISKNLNGAGNYNYGLTVYNGYFQIYADDVDATPTYNPTLIEVPADEWCHIVLTFDVVSQEMHFYLNGVLRYTLSTSHVSNMTGKTIEKLCIGTIYPYGNGTAARVTHNCAGIYDDYKAFRKTLTQEDVDFLYSKGNYKDDLMINSQGYESKNRESGLIAHYKLNGNVLDSSVYKNNGTISGVVYATGKIGQAGDFDNLDYITTYNITTNKGFSASMWINIDSHNGTHSTLFDKDRASNDLWLAVLVSTNKLILQSDGVSLALSSSSSISLSTWYHIVITCTESGHVEMYINNVNEGSDDVTIWSGNNNILRLGDVISAGTGFDGLMDDIRFYNYALSTDEITAIYNSGNGTESESYNKLTVDHVDLRDKFIIPYKHLDSNYQVRNWKLEEDSINNEKMKSLIAIAKFEEGAYEFSKSKSVYGANLYYSQSQPTLDRWDTDTFSKFQKYCFESLSSGSTVDTKLTGVNEDDIFNDYRIYEATWSIWHKPVEVGYNWSWRSDDPSGTQEGTMLSLDSSDGAQSYFEYGYTSSYKQFAFNHIFKIGVWTKVDVVFSHGISKIYIDGELKYLNDNSATIKYIVPSTTNAYTIGSWENGADKDLFKVWERALTDDEIKTLYVSDPLHPYQLSNLVFSKKHIFNPTDSLFIENGLFGIHIDKGLYDEGLKNIGKVSFQYFRNGWEDIGSLRCYSDDGAFHGVSDFKLIEVTPNKTVVRVWMAEESSQANVYEKKLQQSGLNVVFDIILEASKKNATILPRKDISQFNLTMDLATGYYDCVPFNAGVIGFDDVEIAELASNNTVVTPKIPMLLGLSKNDNLLVGWCSTHIPSTNIGINSETTTDWLEVLSFREIDDDPLNERYIFSVFANEYKDPSGNDLVLFYEGEDYGADTADALASGGNVYRIPNTATMYWRHTTLNKGTYMAILRAKNVSGASVINYYVNEGASTTLEQYGFNVGANQNYVLGTSFVTLFLPFVVTDDNQYYDIFVKNVNDATGTDVDLLMLIPLCNGKDFVADLYQQSLTINNIKNIGVL